MIKPHWWHRFVFLVLCLATPPQAFSAPSYITFPSDIDWVQQESEHFQVVFRRGHDDFAARTLRAAERAFRLLDPIFPSGPEKTWIVLADFQDSTNGYAINFPYSHMALFAAPPAAAGQLANLDDWLFSLVLHEYTHIRHIYPVRGLWKPLRFVFGSWVLPNGLMPSHLHEGIATFLETKYTRGGRGRGATFSMYRRGAVLADTWGSDFFPLDRLDGTASIYPHGSAAYFFGNELYRELWKRKGAKGIRELTESYASNWPYLLNGPLAEVYGDDLTYSRLWQQIFEKGRQEAKLEISKARSAGTSEFKALTPHAYQKGDLTLSPDGKFLAFKQASPWEGAALEIRLAADFSLKRSLDVPVASAEGACWLQTKSGAWLIYNRTSSENHYALYSLSAYDPDRNREFTLGLPSRTLRHVHQVGCDAKTPRLAIYREAAQTGFVQELGFDGGGGTPETVKMQREWPVPTGQWVSSLAYAPEGLYFLLRERHETHLYFWPEGGSPRKQRTLGAHFFSLSHYEQALYALGDLDGRTELWQITPAARPPQKRIATLTGLAGYGIHDSGKAHVALYEHGGYAIAETRLGNFERAPIDPITSEGPDSGAKLDSPEPEKSADKLSPVSEYSAWPTLTPKAWVPSVLFVPDGTQFGGFITGFDIAQKHHYTAIAGYDTRGSLFGDLGYERRFAKSSWLGASAFYSPSYILSSRQFLTRWGGSLSFGSSFSWLPPTIRLSALFRETQASSFGPALTSVGMGLGLSYSFGISKKPLDVTPRSGTTLSLNYEWFPTFLGSTQGYFSAIAGWDQALAAPWFKRSGFFLSQRLAYTEGAFLYNSFFQGGGEILFQQGRGSFLNRGFAPGLFLGRRMYNANLEYRFPLWRVERGVGLLPFHLKQLHAALVSDTTSFDAGLMNGRRTALMKIFYTSAGVELKTDWDFFFYLPSQIRLGAYRGFGRFGEDLYITVGMDSFF